jgi:hypothetical protein
MDQKEKFDKLFHDYWEYVHEYKLFSSPEFDKPAIDKEFFEDQLNDTAKMIKLLKTYS